MERLEKLEILWQINQRLGRVEEEASSIKEKVNGFKKSLASLNLDVEELKLKVADKVDNARVLALEDSIEDLVNRSKRNNLVFFNVPEKSENGDCVTFIQHFISAHMGITNDEGHKLEIERAHRTQPGKIVDGKPPRPIHVAFLRYTDKMSVLTKAASSLKDNPFKDCLIGISEDFGKKTTEKRKRFEKCTKRLQTKLAPSKVFIAYPAVLKYRDDSGRIRNVTKEELASVQ